MASLPGTGREFTNLEGPGAVGASSRPPPGLPSSADSFLQAISETRPPSEWHAFTLLWGDRKGKFQTSLCEQIFPVGHNSQDNLLVAQAWRAINGSRMKKSYLHLISCGFVAEG